MLKLKIDRAVIYWQTQWLIETASLLKKYNSNDIKQSHQTVQNWIKLNSSCLFEKIYLVQLAYNLLSVIFNQFYLNQIQFKNVENTLLSKFEIMSK